MKKPVSETPQPFTDSMTSAKRPTTGMEHSSNGGHSWQKLR